MLPVKNPRPSARHSVPEDLKRTAAIFRNRQADTRNGTSWAMP
nr:MAG TPA: hypothetical protein [Caudoviricetes sp.]